MGDAVNEKNVIYVKTLGSYSVSYNGSEIAIGSRDESQIGLLMLLMFHFGKDGASRSLIKNTLFEDRDIEDVSHAIRNVLYNMRKNLKAHGLPDAQFVKQSKGVYYWTDEVPVVEDAREFERLANEALQEPDPKKQADKLSAACYSYSGRFFAGRDNVPWIYQESERYRALFNQITVTLIDYYKDTHKFKAMLDLTLFAVRVDPFSEWEIYVVEALTNLGRFADSERYYEDTVNAYIKEYGDRSNEHVRDFIRRLGDWADAATTAPSLYFRNSTRLLNVPCDVTLIRYFSCSAPSWTAKATRCVRARSLTSCLRG